MTPQEKAKELVNKFAIYLRANLMFDEEADEDAKVCALIAVDEIIEQYEFDVASDVENKRFMAKLNYWDEVKQEIEKL
jgi:LytS/YehU family sensor histidine kinase